MNYFLTRIASIMLAFGLFISCTFLKSTSNTKNIDGLSDSELNQRVSEIDDQLAADSSASLLYQKGLYLTEIAQRQSQPTKRAPYYDKAHNNLQLAVQNAEGDSEPVTSKARELLNVSWSNEHNQGLQIIQRDSTQDIPAYKRAAAHFSNATIIIPDSAISYQLGSRAYYQSQQPKEALALLNKAYRQVPDIPVKLIEQLTFLYLETDKPQEAIAVYKNADSFADQNLNLFHGLSNAYIKAENHQQAIQILNTLVKEKPQNIIYKQSLATELYYHAAQQLDSLKNGMANGATDIDLNAPNTLLTEAETYFEELASDNEQNQEIKQRFVQFYQNSASKYQQLIPYLDQQTKTTVKEQIEEYLTSSLPILKQLVEEEPDKQVYWKSLYQAYQYLGMPEKARKAKSNF